MFLKSNLCIFAILELVQADNNPVAISLHPDEIVKSFKSIVSSDYITLLANEFATKAAEHFIKEMKTTKNKMEKEYNNRLQWGDLLHDNENEGKPQPDNSKGIQTDTLQLNSEEVQEDWSKILTKKSQGPDIKFPKVLTNTDTDKPLVLNEEQAMTLLDDPSPDGDNLGEQLTDAEGEGDSKTVPVVEVLKINGVYFRRLLGMI